MRKVELALPTCSNRKLAMGFPLLITSRTAVAPRVKLNVPDSFPLEWKFCPMLRYSPPNFKVCFPLTHETRSLNT